MFIHRVMLTCILFRISHTLAHLPIVFDMNANLTGFFKNELAQVMPLIWVISFSLFSLFLLLFSFAKF